MQKYRELTGRAYRPFDYYGPPDAKDVIIAMGSVCGTVRETIEYLSNRGVKAGLLAVRLYRPFSGKYFFEALPPGVERIAVLDRTKEPGAPGEPLYLDVCSMFSGRSGAPLIVGGRYGLGSKDTTPQQILAVYNNLRAARPINGFTVGIDDDVTNLSLPEDRSYAPPENGEVTCQFWGLGSDGTVGANKTACRIIGENTDLNVQAYFSYDSKKSGGTTVSHLKFGKNPILSSYLTYKADYLACHNKTFLNNYDLSEYIRPGGIFVLNCDRGPDDVGDILPAPLKRCLASGGVRFYIIDAEKIASEIGLGNRINMIMQSAFFSLMRVVPPELAMRLLKESNEKSYGRKGGNIVQMNNAAVDRGAQSLVKVDVPAEWADARDNGGTDDSSPGFVRRIQRVMASNRGDSLPVSAFSGMEDGSYPLGTTSYEKRGIAPFIPEWLPDNCIQCGRCSFVCPHATIRMFLLDGDERSRSPARFEVRKAAGKGLEAYSLRVQVSPLDCTGCGNCADICPSKEKALVMKAAASQIDAESDNWEFAMTLTEKPDLVDRFTVRGSQLMRPLLEFSGACPGCGETPYVRLLTQLFGDRMMIANATGCSSIWAASAPSIAYSTGSDGRGPAWASSLFEDNAEYGYGMYLGVRQLRERLEDLVMQAHPDEGVDRGLRQLFRDWLEKYDDGPASLAISKEIVGLLEKTDLSQNPVLRKIYELRSYLEKRSVWMIGGDGWAYDIGYGGLDHVIASGGDVNMLVLDTEVYSNTGGQASKSTPEGAVARFAYGGKRTRKKDLGMMAISYGSVYVAQIAIGADMNQTIKAMREAESFPGPSLLIAYAPCINHGIKAGMSKSIAETKKAVDCGYWQLYRYDPRVAAQGGSPFILDSKEPSMPYREFLEGEVRYTQIYKTSPSNAGKLFEKSQRHAKQRFEAYAQMAARTCHPPGGGTVSSPEQRL